MFRIVAFKEKPQNSEPTIKPYYIMEGKGERELFFFKKFFSYKNRSFAKQFLSQEAPPPISLETEGEVLGWSHYSPYSK